MWRQADGFDSRQSSVRAWLLLLTHHKAVDRVRSEERRKTSELLPENDHEDERPGPDAQGTVWKSRETQSPASTPSHG